MSPVEQSLLQRWADHRDAEAFAELVRRYAGLVYGTCRRILRNENEAEDVAQECFLKLAQTGRASIESLGGWLHRVATREALNRLKAEQRRSARDTAYASEHPRHAEIQWDDLQVWVDEALDALPEDMREPVIRHFLQGETHDEIARSLRVSRSTITRRIAQGIEQVRNNLRKRGVEVAVTVLTASMAAHMVEAAPATLRASLGRFALSGAGDVKPSPPVGDSTHVPSLSSAPGILAVAAAVALLAGAWWLGARSSEINRETTNATPAVVSRGEALPEEVVADADIQTPPPADVAAAAPAIPQVEAAPEQGGTETVSLRCVDPSGDPLAGAEVYFVHMESLAGAMTYPASDAERIAMTAGPVVADADGWVHIANVPRFQKRFGGRGAYARVPGTWAGIWNEAGFKRPGLEAGAEIRLSPVVEVRGVVTLPANTPPASVTVSVLTLYRRGVDAGSMFSPDPSHESLRWPEVFAAVPDETGAFAIHDMPDDAAVYLAADGSGLANTQYMGSEIKGTTINLTMEPEAILEGQVVQEGSGDPVAGAAVLVQAYQAVAVTLPYIPRTDAAGRYRVTGLTPGRHTVRLLPGTQPSAHNARPLVVDLISGHATVAPVMTVERGALVSGNFRDSKAGTPIEGATVVALHPARLEGTPVGSATTGPDGNYVMRLPSGEFMFYLFDVTDHYEYPKDQGRREVVVPAMQQSVIDIDFMLTPRTAPMPTFESATVEGIVVDDAGDPVKGAKITDNEERDDGSFTSSPVGHTGADGRFTITVRAGSKHEIGVGGGAFTLDRSESFAPEANQTLELDAFVVKRLHGVFTGTVVDDDGAPLANATLYVSSRNVTWRSEDVVTDADGRFSIDPAPENDVMYVHIRKPGYGKGYYQAFEDVPSEEERVYTLKKEE